MPSLQFLVRLNVLIGLAVLASSTSGAETRPAEVDSDLSDWIVLYDGTNTDAWREYGKEGITTGWKFEDGAMTVLATEDASVDRRENLITKEKFGAFELELEFRVTPAANSGVMYHVVETKGPPYKTGPEIQIQDNVDGYDPQKCGWLYQLYSAKTDATKPAGQWNRLRILVTPEKCVHEMNGVTYVEYVKGSPDWDQRVAKSKFAKWDGFGKANSGHICLQDHSDEVSYRNIRIRRLDR